VALPQAIYYKSSVGDKEMKMDYISNKCEGNIRTTEILKNSLQIKEDLDLKNVNELKKADSEKNIKSLNKNDVEKAIKRLKQSADIFNRRLDFSIDEKTNRLVVKVIDTKTDKIIKEIPPEQLLRLAAKIQEMIGLLIDEER